jgi:glycogen debranching enzyme
MISADPFGANGAEIVSPRDRVTLVNGRTFTVAGPDGSLRGSSEGTVFEDIRMLSMLRFEVHEPNRAAGERAVLFERQHLTTATPTPFSSVSVSRRAPNGSLSEPTEFFAHRQWVGRGSRHDFEIHNSGETTIDRVITLHVSSDFAHVFEMKSGHRSDVEPTFELTGSGGFALVHPDPERDLRVVVDLGTPPTAIDESSGVVSWRHTCRPRDSVCVSVTFEPVWRSQRSHLLFPLGRRPDVEHAPRSIHARDSVERPTLQTNDDRLARSFERSLTDLTSLRIFDPGSPRDVVVAAGAPWFMTLFGRDSLLTAWMALPFVPDLAVGVLHVLGALQGNTTRPESEEELGKIIHELRREGGSDAFAKRGRYYGTVDATPLYVMLAAETHRWGHLDDGRLERLWPHVVAATQWIRRKRRSGPGGFLSYRRSTDVGLVNQGWKDSWDGVSFADGRLPSGAIALAEVQGYAYAALRGAAYLSRLLPPCELDPDELLREANELRERFNTAFWHEASSAYAVGLVDDGVRIDSVTTNPGHAVWTGIAEPELAHRYLDRCVGGDLWTGWGLRTLSPTAAAYNPLSYHNGSVWPHDTALVIAGASVVGRPDIVDVLVDGCLDAADHFAGRPPELFAGTDRAEFPSPIDYPNSCSPQAWASASVLMNLRSQIAMSPPASPDQRPTVGNDGEFASRISRLSGVRVGAASYEFPSAQRPEDPCGAVIPPGQH